MTAALGGHEAFRLLALLLAEQLDTDPRKEPQRDAGTEAMLRLALTSLGPDTAIAELEYPTAMGELLFNKAVEPHGAGFRATDWGREVAQRWGLTTKEEDEEDVVK